MMTTMVTMTTLMAVWSLRLEIVPLTPPLGHITSTQSNIPRKLSKRRLRTIFSFRCNILLPFLPRKGHSSKTLSRQRGAKIFAHTFTSLH